MERACPALPAPLTPSLPLRAQVPGKEAAVPPMEAIKIALDTASAKFTETVEVRRLQLSMMGGALFAVCCCPPWAEVHGLICVAAVLRFCTCVVSASGGLHKSRGAWLMGSCWLCAVALHAACAAQQPAVMLPASCVSITMPSWSGSPLHGINCHNCHTPLCLPAGARQAEHRS